MIRAMRTAASGMSAQQIQIDTVANNLANVNTTGFKRTRIDFQDLMYQSVRQAGTPAGDGQVPTGLQVGLGTRAAATQKIFSQGVFEKTDNPLDLVIEGDGFFQVTLPDGTVAYTRDGAFKRDSTGSLVTSDGFKLEPSIVIPPEATSVSVSPEGMVSVTVPGATEAQEVGQITLTRFVNPAGLQSTGRNLMLATASSGDPVTGNPGIEGTGTLAQGFLEKSNVEVVEEMVQMISAQRAYEINSRVIRGADEMLRTVTELSR